MQQGAESFSWRAEPGIKSTEKKEAAEKEKQVWAFSGTRKAEGLNTDKVLQSFS